ncbi:MAG TPA: sigma-70 family RNA polymerase sigma factor [Chthoniobacterales bacterium]
MNTANKSDATQILREWNEGDKDAPARLMPLVYEELRRLGAAYLRNERPDHTLGATALVHEAYLKLVDQDAISWKNSIHFRTIAARAMRRVLVEHARAHRAEKRGGKLQKIYLDETKELSQEQGPDLVELDEALQSFASTYPRESEVVELKFFGGLNASEIADALDVSIKTVSRDWTFAKLWLCNELTARDAIA